MWVKSNFMSLCVVYLHLIYLSFIPAVCCAKASPLVSRIRFKFSKCMKIQASTPQYMVSSKSRLDSTFPQSSSLNFLLCKNSFIAVDCHSIVKCVGSILAIYRSVEMSRVDNHFHRHVNATTINLTTFFFYFALVLHFIWNEILHICTVLEFNVSILCKIDRQIDSFEMVFCCCKHCLAFSLWRMLGIRLKFFRFSSSRWIRWVMDKKNENTHLSLIKSAVLMRNGSMWFCSRQI